MIAKDYSFIFIQPPKNATTSIRDWLMERGLVEEGPWKRHAKSFQIKQAIEKSIWDNALKFSVVRCPYDRAVSTYLYIKTLAENPSEAVVGKPFTLKSEEWSSKVKNFDEFMKLSVSDATLSNYLHNTKQAHFIHAPGEFQLILRMERLDEDFEKLCSMLGVGYSKLPVHNNSVGRKPWKEYYTQKAYELVGNLYKDDFELLKVITI